MMTSIPFRSSAPETLAVTGRPKPIVGPGLLVSVVSAALAGMAILAVVRMARH